MTKKIEFLAVTALGENKQGAAKELTSLIDSCECHVIDCRISTLGAQFCAHLLLSGNWSAIAKLETLLPTLNEKVEINCLWQRTKPANIQPDTIPYAAITVGIDKAGLMHSIIDFFTVKGININDFYCDTYPARYSGTLMTSISMSISVDKKFSMSELREQFLLFCDQHNLDGIIEPEK